MSFQPLIDKCTQLQNRITKYDLQAEKRTYPRITRHIELARGWFNSSLAYYKKVCNEYQANPFVAYLTQDEKIPRTLNQIIEIVYASANSVLGSNAPIELYLLVDLVLRTAAEMTDTAFVLQDDQVFGTATLKKFLISYVSTDISVTTPSELPPTDCYGIKYTSSEVTNPFSWPLLIHESFHIIEEEKSILAKLTPLTEIELPVKKEEEEDWKKELFIDLMSTLFFGPVYVFSLVGKFRMVPYYSHSTHPSMEVRVAAAKKYLERARPQKPINVAQETFASIASSTIRYLTPVTIKDEKLDKAIDAFVNAFGSQVETKTSFFQLLESWFPNTGETIGPPRVSVDDIRSWMGDGIELAVDPRILLNFVLTDEALIAKAPGQVPEITTNALLSSLKKWRVYESFRSG